MTDDREKQPEKQPHFKGGDLQVLLGGPAADAGCCAHPA
jgi:hypothetical protein